MSSLINISNGRVPEPDDQAHSVESLWLRELEVFQQKQIDEETVELCRRLSDPNRQAEVTSSEVSNRMVGILRMVHDLEKRCSSDTNLGLYIVGRIAELQEKRLQRKSDYTKWVRDVLIPGLAERNLVLGEEAIRQARKISKMGRYALEYLHLPKNVLLEWYYLLGKTEGVTRHPDGTISHAEMNDILARYPLVEGVTVHHDNAELARLHFDAQLTLFLLWVKAPELFKELVTFENARLLSAYRHKAIEPSMVDDIKADLEAAMNTPLAGETKEAAKKRCWRDYLRGYMKGAKVNRKVKGSAEKVVLLVSQTTSNLQACLGNEILWRELAGDPKGVAGLKDLRKKVNEAIRKLGEAQAENNEVAA